MGVGFGSRPLFVEEKVGVTRDAETGNWYVSGRPPAWVGVGPGIDRTWRGLREGNISSRYERYPRLFRKAMSVIELAEIEDAKMKYDPGPHYEEWE